MLLTFLELSCQVSGKCFLMAMASIHHYFARKQVGDTQKRGKPKLQKFTRFALICVTSARPWVCKCPLPQIPVSQSPFWWIDAIDHVQLERSIAHGHQFNNTVTADVFSAIVIFRYSGQLTKPDEESLSTLNQLLAMEMRLRRQKWLSSDVLYAPIGLGVVTLIMGEC